MELHLKIIGVLLIFLAFVHAIFPRYFNWEKEMNLVSQVNREIMYVHTFFIAVVLLLIGLLCFFSADEITGTVLGRKIAFGFGIFWLLRLIIQFFGYSSGLWKGKPFETFIHILFSFTWAYFTFIFFYIFFCPNQ